ncbi:MAG: hypothetical protein ACR2NB_12185 [Solirubrobacteraceae bacterium]
MDSVGRSAQLQHLASKARAAEARGEAWATSDAWRRYELVRDGGRDPDELLAEGMALSQFAIDLAQQADHHEA